MDRGIEQRPQRAVAGPGNFIAVLVILAAFPLLLIYSGALSVTHIPSADPRHTPALLCFCLTVGSFLWGCFGVVWAGISRNGSVRPLDLIGLRRGERHPLLREIGVAFLALVVMTVIGNLTAALGAAFHTDSTANDWFVATHWSEALCFIALALSAGFVEEFIFRGYLQAQFTALTGGKFLGSILQIAVFTAGHSYQGGVRLLAVALLGTVLTGVALWRRTLVPGMIAHGIGDSLVGLSFVVHHI